MSARSAWNRIDYEILEALQKDARLSNKELAAKVDLAPSSCLERVKKLRAGGALRGFHAAVDPEVLGIGLEALVAVRIRQHSRRLIDEFQEHALSLPETVTVYHVAGASDFLVHVAVRDAAHLRDLALDAFTTRDEVDHIETSLIFGHRGNRVLPNYAEGAGGGAGAGAGSLFLGRRERFQVARSRHRAREQKEKSDPVGYNPPPNRGEQDGRK